MSRFLKLVRGTAFSEDWCKVQTNDQAENQDVPGFVYRKDMLVPNTFYASESI